MSEQAQWSTDVHLQWAGEQLVFWRLGFYPTYRRKEISEALEVICGRHEIRGKVVYEVYGQHDLLIRFWLPPGVKPDEVERDIKRTLTALHLELCDRFVVSNISTHWFWDEEGGADRPPPKPSSQVLASPPQHHLLRDVSDLVERFNVQEIDRQTLENDATAREYLEQGLIGIREIRDGIKFAIIVSVSGELGTRYTAMEALGGQLLRILCSSPAVMERSLYSGEGFGRFLILGKISPADFFEIGSSLIAPIVDEANLSGVYRTRSITYIANSPRLMSFSEVLALPEPSKDEEELNIDEVLAGGENARVEFKASVFVNVDRLIHKKERTEDDAIVETFLRAIVAMLNSNGGGVVVGGVLEASSRNYAEHFAKEPRTDGLILIGAEFDWADWRRGEWDEFENRMRQKLQDLIEPDPMTFIKIGKHIVKGRTLCTVLVEAAPPIWFYLRTGQRFDFAVRRGASSKVISGPEEEHFKRLSPRP